MSLYDSEAFDILQVTNEVTPVSSSERHDVSGSTSIIIKLTGVSNRSVRTELGMPPTTTAGCDFYSQGGQQMSQLLPQIS